MKAPTDADEFRNIVIERYDGLSKRLKQVADFILNNPNELALEPLVVIAERCQTQPSTFVRFAKLFGFSGAAEMQKMYRRKLYSSDYVPSYEERLRQFRDENGTKDKSGLLNELADSTVIALDHLKNSVKQADVDKAVQLIENSRMVYCLGLGRSFPVASYISYGLHRLDKPAVLMSGVGGTLAQEARTIAPDDLLIVTSFHPSAPEIDTVVSEARGRKASVVVISDNMVSNLVRDSDIFLQVQDADLHHFRSLSATMCLAQSLIMGFAATGGASA